MHEPNALRFALHQKPDSLHVHESEFNQVEDDDSTPRVLTDWRSSGSCAEPIRPLTLRMVAPPSTERTILSIEIDQDCEHTDGNPRAARNSLCGIGESIGSHERSRVARERSRVSRGRVAGGRGMVSAKA